MAACCLPLLLNQLISIDEIIPLIKVAFELFGTYAVSNLTMFIYSD